MLEHLKKITELTSIKDYNSFYQSCPIIKEENQNIAEFRLQVSDLTARIIKKGMFILGINVPERM